MPRAVEKLWSSEIRATERDSINPVEGSSCSEPPEDSSESVNQVASSIPTVKRENPFSGVKIVEAYSSPCPKVSNRTQQALKRHSAFKASGKS